MGGPLSPPKALFPCSYCQRDDGQHNLVCPYCEQTHVGGIRIGPNASGVPSTDHRVFCTGGHVVRYWDDEFKRVQEHFASKKKPGTIL
jgi:hypothetical protein